jgi:DNA-binding NarL/FixJ family response regulator
MRQALVSLGYEDITDAADHAVALDKLEERSFTHIIFDTKDLKIPAKDFLATVLNKSINIIAIPASLNPTVDEVFELLIGGARGYIAKPCTSGGLEEAIVWATKGESISGAVVKATSRNEALAMLVLSTLSKLALVMRQAREFETAKREVPRKWAILNRAIEIARTFAKGGDAQLRIAIVNAAIKSAESKGPVRTTTARRHTRRRNSASKSSIDVTTVTN